MDASQVVRQSYTKRDQKKKQTTTQFIKIKIPMLVVDFETTEENKQTKSKENKTYRNYIVCARAYIFI